MAILPQKPLFDPIEIPDGFTALAEEYAIGGKMLSLSMDITAEEAMQHWNDKEWRAHIRHKVATLFAEKMISDNLCEINVAEDPITQNKKIIMRCYLAPNEQVKILRTLKNPLKTPNGNR